MFTLTIYQHSKNVFLSIFLKIFFKNNFLKRVGGKPGEHVPKNGVMTNIKISISGILPVGNTLQIINFMTRKSEI